MKSRQVCGAASRVCAGIISSLAGRQGENWQRLMETMGPLRSHRELRPPGTWQWLSTMPAGSLLATATREREGLSPSWCLLVSRLVVVIAHHALGHVASLKPRRESAPWGEGARRGNVPAECWRGAVGAYLILMKAGESRSLRKVWERRRQLCEPAHSSWSV